MGPSLESSDTVKYKQEHKPFKLDTNTLKPEKLPLLEPHTPKLLHQQPTMPPSVLSQLPHYQYQLPQQPSLSQQPSTDQPQLIPYPHQNYPTSPPYRARTSSKQSTI